MKVWSPTQTQTFLECPMKWMLHQAGWRRDRTNLLDYTSALGKLVGAHMEERFNNKAGLTAEALAEVKTLYPADSKALTERFEKLDTFMPKFMKALDAGIEAIADWEVLAAELLLVDAGMCRPDLVCRDADGEIVVVEIKTVFATTEYLIEKRFEDLEFSWQIYHYIWALRQFTPYWPTSFLTVLMVATGGKPHYRTLQCEVDEEFLERWEAAAKQTWQDMNDILEGKRPIGMNPVHRTPYGECEFKAGCLQAGGALELVRGYVKEVK